jgi:Mn-containing catalase
MIAAANAAVLSFALEKHLSETEDQIDRLKEAFSLLGEDATAKPCTGMAGLLEEGDEAIDEGEDKADIAADLALIAAAQKVEHYEISAYGTARSLAGQAGRPAVAELLSRTLAEEEVADNLLTQIARELIGEARGLDKGRDATPVAAAPAKSRSHRRSKRRS